MTPLNVDFDLLKAVGAPQAFTQIDLSLRPLLAPLPEVLDRMDGCIHFCFKTNESARSDPMDDADSATRRRKFLRAALCEFGSLGDAAKLDFGALGKHAPDIHQLLHPQIHIVRLLRHANVHLAASALTKESRPAVWTTPNGSEEFEHTHYVVAHLARTIEETKGARHYASRDLQRMLDWLEHEQREWGIANVVHRTAETYAGALVDSLNGG